ncbi:MAG TPA: dihydropteroate synthase [Acidobacteriaceae bacterium]|jgi:dihydropteroate synthase|nr:dihydropteroate synthase [Acidobacteriaceae bacterium]
MPFARRPLATWQIRTRTLPLGTRTLVMGVLNVTPDSFSDGGLYFGTHVAAEHALAMLDDGADLIDIGGESTRPGSQGLCPEDEQDRVLPVIEAILRERHNAVLSVDTYKASTASAAAAAGAEIINDVSSLTWDPDMGRTCARTRCGVILMHTRGRPDEWRTQPRLAPDAVIPLVQADFVEALARADASGIERNRIVLDPGYGFGKIHDDNYPLLAHLDDLLALGSPLLAGVSRKSFLGRTVAAATGTDDVPVHGRAHATIAATTAAILAGASIIRVHDVRPAVEAAAISDAILNAL